MKVVVLYRPDSEHGRLTEEFIHNFQQLSDPQRLEILNIDSRDGSALASLYDIMQYPAVLVIGFDGSLHKSWVGDTLPLIDEVVAYSRV